MAGFSEIAENSENIHRHCALCPRPVLKIDELLRGSLGIRPIVDPRRLQRRGWALLRSGDLYFPAVDFNCSVLVRVNRVYDGVLRVELDFQVMSRRSDG